VINEVSTKKSCYEAKLICGKCMF